MMLPSPTSHGPSPPRSCRSARCARPAGVQHCGVADSGRCWTPTTVSMPGKLCSTQQSCTLLPSEHDAAEVAAQRGEQGGHVAAGADEHVADQHGIGMDVGGGMDDQDGRRRFQQGMAWFRAGGWLRSVDVTAALDDARVVGGRPSDLVRRPGSRRPRVDARPVGSRVRGAGPIEVRPGREQECRLQGAGADRAWFRSERRARKQGWRKIVVLM